MAATSRSGSTRSRATPSTRTSGRDPSPPRSVPRLEMFSDVLHGDGRDRQPDLEHHVGAELPRSRRRDLPRASRCSATRRPRWVARWRSNPGIGSDTSRRGLVVLPPCRLDSPTSASRGRALALGPAAIGAVNAARLLAIRSVLTASVPAFHLAHSAVWGRSRAVRRCRRLWAGARRARRCPCACSRERRRVPILLAASALVDSSRWARCGASGRRGGGRSTPRPASSPLSRHRPRRWRDRALPRLAVTLVAFLALVVRRPASLGRRRGVRAGRSPVLVRAACRVTGRRAGRRSATRRESRCCSDSWSPGLARPRWSCGSPPSGSSSPELTPVSRGRTAPGASPARDRPRGRVHDWGLTKSSTLDHAK